MGTCIPLKYYIRSDNSIGVHASGVLTGEREIKELVEIPDKLCGCGAKLVYLDFAGCNFIDSRIISPIILLQRKLAQYGCEFEIRIYDSRLLAFFKEIELDKIVKIRDATRINSGDIEADANPFRDDKTLSQDCR